MTPLTTAGGAGATPRVVVVGDVVLDREIDGRVDRLSPDAPVPVLDVTGAVSRPGAAGLTALLAAASGARVTLIAPFGDDPAGRHLLDMLEEQVEVGALGHHGPTRRKTRLRSGGQSLLRMDDGGPGSPTDVPEARVRAALRSADAVLVSDYGAGVTRDPGIRRLLADAALHRPLVWDPHPRGGPPVPGAALVTPNLAEAAAAGRALAVDTEQPDVLADRLRSAWSVRAVCVTVGAYGAFLSCGDDTHFIPAPVVPSAGDTCGAGDRFAATAAVALGRGRLPSEACTQAVADASAWVAAGGAAAFRMTGRSVSAGPPGAGNGAAPATTDRRPPASPANLSELAARLRAGRGTLVATGGCFDIVHAGHVATLQAARRLGDALVVLMNSDESVSRLKGPGRPVIAAHDRARVLEAFDCVDAVVVFDADDPSAALAELRPDIWVKGGDYGGSELPESATVRAAGGRVVFLPYLSGRSTTSIIEKSAVDIGARTGKREA